MKYLSLFTTLTFVAFLTAFLPTTVYSQAGAIPPVQISDIPRETQLGSGTPPEGTPGKEKGYVPPVPARKDLPTLWIIGDSTVRNGTKGSNRPDGEWGWGGPITAYFDLNKINVVNRAMGGTSSRSFYNGFYWQNLKPQIKKGDFVILQFGANDNGGATGRGGLDGVSDKTEKNGEETVYTFGEYLRKYVKETRAQEGIPIICSLIPRKKWLSDGTFQKENKKHAAWAEQVARETNSPFVSLHNIAGQKYEDLGKEKVETLFLPVGKGSLHTSWDGAVVNAECVIAALKALPSDPLGEFLSERGRAVPSWKP